MPDELIFNVDQSPSKFIAATNVTMAEKGSITLTLAETLSSAILPSQVIYKGKTRKEDIQMDSFFLIMKVIGVKCTKLIVC